MTTWGQTFVTTPLATRTGGDVFRILASENATEVKVDGTTVATLNGGQFYEASFGSSQYSEITADKPVLVTQYMKGQQADGVNADPMMMLVMPTEQFLPSYIISTPGGAFNQASSNYINVTAPATAVGSILLDGVAIPASSFTPIGSSGFSGAQINISPGTHRLQATERFGVAGYGFASFDSYGYPAGGAFEVLAGAINNFYATLENSSLTVTAGGTPDGLLANDDVGDNPPIAVVSHDSISANGGAVVVQPDGSFTYTPLPGFFGQDTFAYTIEDAVGTQDTATVVITVVEVPNDPPVADAGGPYTIDEGDSLTLDGSGSSDPDGDALSYEWDLDNDGIFGDATGVSPTLTWAQLTGFGIADDGSYPIKLRVDDGNGEQNTDTSTITVENIAPIVDNVVITSPINENSSAVLTGDITDPSMQDSFTMVVDWGDGTPQETVNIPAGSTSFSATHQYLDDTPTGTPSDTFSVTIVSFTDDDGDAANTAGGAGGNIYLTGHDVLLHGGQNNYDAVILDFLRGAGTSSEIVKADYDIAVVGSGVGFANFSGASGFTGLASGSAIPLTGTLSGYGSATYFKTGSGLDWTDILSRDALVILSHTNCGGCDLSTPGSNEINAQSADIATAVNAGMDIWGLSGATLSTYYDFLPPGAVASGVPIGGSSGFTATGDGVAIGIQNNMINGFPTHNRFASFDPVFTVYETRGSEIISLGVQSAVISGGGIGTGLSVTVNNIAPEVDPLVLSSTSIDENGTVTVNGSFTDVGTLDTHTVTIDWGDGTSSAATVTQGSGSGTFTATHQYLDDGPSPGNGTASDDYTITATVTDDDTGSDSASTVITVNNVAPTVDDLAVTSPIDENDFATLSGNIVDPGTLDTFTLEVDWGDGSPVETFSYPAGTTSFSETHQYLDDDPTVTSSDDYEVIVTLKDDDGGTATNIGAGGQPQYFPFGPQANVPDSDLDGWEVCWSSLYGVGGHAFSDVLADCDGDYLLLAGGPVDSNVFDVVATGERADVLFDTGTGNTPHNANGVGWYFSQNYSMGFAKEGDPLNRTSCDAPEFLGVPDNPELRLCWHTGSNSIQSGWRSGANIWLNSSSSFERFIYQPASVDLLTITVNNANPVANAGADQTVNEGDLVTLSGSFTDQGTDDGHKQEWSVVASNGESITGQTTDNLSGDSDGAGGSSFSFTPGDNGTYTVTYTVTDDDGGVHSDVSVITVDNVAPQLQNVAIMPEIDENDFATLSGDIIDPGTLDTFILTIDWGDGTVETFNYAAGTSSFSKTHQYLDDNPPGTPSDSYTISATVTDDDSGVGSNTETVTVNNVAPSLVLDPVVAIDENGVATLTGTITDPGTLDTFTLDVDWGDPLSPDNTETYTFGASSTGSQTFTLTHQYLDDNPSGTPFDSYTISVTVTDDDTGTGSDTQSVTVNNVAPAITTFVTDSPFCGSADENEMVTATLEFTDPGTLDTHEVIVDWGDGNSDTIQLSGGERTLAPTHVYATGGVFNVTVSVQDDDTAIDLASTTVVVTGVGVAGDTLYVVGTDGDDQVSINQTGNGTIKVHADFLADPDNPRNISGAGVEQIFVILCGGDDHASISHQVTLPAIIDGGDGDDHLIAGGGGAVLLGGNGDDKLSGGSGNDIMIGGAGLDRLVGGGGEDFMAGGSSSYESDSSTQMLADDAALLGFLEDWGGPDSRSVREAALDDLVSSLTADGDQDKLTGAAGDDWFLADAEDLVTVSGL